MSSGNGQFKTENLNDNWKDKNTEEQKVLIGFMQQCEICFELTDYGIDFDKKIWVAPSLLPEKIEGAVKAHFKDNETGIVYLCLTHDFLHYGVIQSFIVRTNKLSDTTKMWRNGTWIDSDNAMAIIEADERKNEINIRVKGNGKKILLDKIRNELKQIHDTPPVAFASITGEDYMPLSEFDKSPDQNEITFENKIYKRSEYRDFLNVDDKVRFKEDEISEEKNIVKEKNPETVSETKHQPIIINNYIEMPKQEISQTPSSSNGNENSSIWSLLSVVLVVAAIVFALVYAFSGVPLIIAISAIVILVFVIAFWQLINDGKISENAFIKLVQTLLTKIPGLDAFLKDKNKGE